MKNFHVLIFSILVLCWFDAAAQNVGVNQTAPTNSLHVSPTAPGQDPIRVDGVQMYNIGDTSLLMINPTSGLVRYINPTDFVSDVLTTNDRFNTEVLTLVRDSIETTIDSVTLAGTMLTIHTGSSNVFVDLTSISADADADPGNELQSLTLAGNTLTLSNSPGSPVSLSGFLDNTDNQNLNSSVSGSTATIGITGGAGTSFSVNDADSNPSNEFNTGATLTGTNLNIIDGGGTQTVNLAALQDGVNDADSNPSNELNTNVTLSGTTLNVIDAGGTQSVNLSSLVNDADSNPSNEYNTAVSLNGTTLNVVDGGGTKSVNLSSLSSSDSDWFEVGGTNPPNAITDNMYTQGRVGIGVPAPTYTMDIYQNVIGTTVRISSNRILQGNYDYEAGPNLLLELPDFFYSERTAQGIFFNRSGENVEWFAGNPSEYVFGANGDGFGIGRMVTTGGAHNNDAARGQNIKLYIDNGGDVGIGLNNPTYALQLPNNALNDVGRAIGYSWNTYSDGRLKTNQQPLSYGLKEIMDIEPMSYEHHSSYWETINSEFTVEADFSNDIGFIAQDLHKIIPEAVSQPADESKELWSVDYTRLVPVLTKALQEQQELIEELKSRIDALEANQN